MDRCDAMENRGLKLLVCWSDWFGGVRYGWLAGIFDQIEWRVHQAWEYIDHRKILLVWLIYVVNQKFTGKNMKNCTQNGLPCLNVPDFLYFQVNALILAKIMLRIENLH